MHGMREHEARRYTRAPPRMVPAAPPASFARGRAPALGASRITRRLRLRVRRRALGHATAPRAGVAARARAPALRASRIRCIPHPVRACSARTRASRMPHEPWHTRASLAWTPPQVAPGQPRAPCRNGPAFVCGTSSAACVRLGDSGTSPPYATRGAGAPLRDRLASLASRNPYSRARLRRAATQAPLRGACRKPQAPRFARGASRHCTACAASRRAVRSPEHAACEVRSHPFLRPRTRIPNPRHGVRASEHPADKSPNLTWAGLEAVGAAEPTLGRCVGQDASAASLSCSSATRCA